MLEKSKKAMLFIVATGMFYFPLAPAFRTVAGAPKAPNAGVTASIYNWRQSATADWQDPSSWTPARVAPASNDVLRFLTGGTCTATNVPTQTFGQLIVSANTTVAFQSAVPVTLTVTGGADADLFVESSSSLTLAGTNGITVDLMSGTTGIVKGGITFSSTSPAAHRLTALDSGSITFESGATFTAGNGLTGNPFGTTNQNSVVFEAGATYVCMDGGDPFGAPQPSSVVVFRKGSLFSLRGNAQSSFFSGRTYANFEFNYPGGDVAAEGNSALVMDNLTLTAGRFHIWLVGTNNSIKGDITTMPGTLLDFQAAYPGQTINLNGSAPQTLTVFGGIGMNPAYTLAINNPDGITVETFFASWNLQLINGVVAVINPDPRARFEVAGTVTRANGYITGSFLRGIDSAGTYTFDVGTRDGYSPVTVDVTLGHDFPAAIRAKAVQMAQPDLHDPSKALSRYWTVLPSDNITLANLTFQYLDQDVPPTANESNFVIEKYNGAFTQPAGLIDTSANTFRINGVTDATGDWTLAEPSALLPPRTLFDFDGDSKADISVFRPSTAAWYLDRSTAGFYGAQFGSSTDKPVPADFTGDGKTDIAFWRASTGEWYVLRSEDSTFYAFPFGAAGDIPVPADFDGDGKADAAVYRPSAQTWFILRSTGGVSNVPFGLSGDVPVPADYDGDGKADIAIYRPNVGQWWYLRSSNNGVFAATFGSSTDKPVPGDYTGDGKADIAFYRPSEGNWYVLRSEDFTYYAFPFGNSTDKPAPADFDGDGKYDAAVFRPSDTNWYILKSSGGVQIQQFGAAGDIPLPGAFIP